MPIDPISAGASIGGEALGLLNDFRTSRDIDKAMALALKNRGRIQGDIDARLMAEISGLRGLTPEAERADAMGEFVARLREARASQPTSYGARGSVSGREAADLADLQTDLGHFAGREADITARIDSQQRMREGEARSINRAGTDVRQLTNRMASQDFLDQLRIARKAKSNPWLDLGASVLKGFGSVTGFGGGGGFDADAFQKSSGSFMKENFSR